jgi:hypothetical protein
MILQRTALVLSAILSAGLVLVLLAGIVPLLQGGDNYELAVKLALLVLVAVYASVQWKAVARSRPRLLAVGLCLNALVLFPLGAAAALCYVFGGPKIMPNEAGAVGGGMAVFSIAVAVMQIAILMRSTAAQNTIPEGD